MGGELSGGEFEDPLFGLTGCDEVRCGLCEVVAGAFPVSPLTASPSARSLELKGPKPRVNVAFPIASSNSLCSSMVRSAAA